MPSISEFFENDHRRLDEIFTAFQQSTGPKAKQTFELFKSGLQRHIEWEEQLLFPVLEQSAGLPNNAGPTRVMRIEHEQIHQCLALIEEKMDEREERDLVERRLMDILAEHNVKEERILYPMCDSMIASEDSLAIVSKCSSQQQSEQDPPLA